MSDELEQHVKKLETLLGESAPAWVVTFGDLMSLLLCFFVLMLSFSEIDAAKYKEIAGALAQAFGVQRKTPVFESPKAEKMIARDFDQESIPMKQQDEVGEEQSDLSEIGKEYARMIMQEEVESSFHDQMDLIQVKADKSRMVFRLMGETTFDSGKAKIRKQMIPLLKKIGSFVKRTKGDIIVAGHTDNVPIRGRRFKSNLQLSTARATSVVEFLIHQISIEPKRISTMGFGEYRPLESNKTAKGREMNRRVEIILTREGLPSLK
ncbi:MAG: flagellar motor protein MotB [Thermodesulfobacteriota bacterium]|nr:flagellar motor protein MotB [Thermodesulfobacteriota bacterium]